MRRNNIWCAVCGAPVELGFDGSVVCDCCGSVVGAYAPCRASDGGTGSGPGKVRQTLRRAKKWLADDLEASRSGNYLSSVKLACTTIVVVMICSIMLVLRLLGVI